MPTAEGTYSVHLDIFSNDQLIEAYRAAEDVNIGVAEPGIIGDLDDDGVLTTNDLNILEKYVGGYPISQISPLTKAEFLRRADVNGDGKINALDITALERLLEAPSAQCPLSVSASPSSGGSVTRSPYKSLYDDGEMITVTAIAKAGWAFDKFTGVRFDGSSWETKANPVYARGCRTKSVTAHFI